MNNYCAFSKNNKCLKWMDYEITRHELEEADDLCHGNRIEIQRKTNTYKCSRRSWNRTGSTIRKRYDKHL